MKLNHLNLTVTNVLEAENFLAKYFDLQNQRTEGDNRNMGFLFDDNGMVISLMKPPHGAEVVYPGYFHIGFIQESEEQVNQLYQRLIADGFDAPPPERHHGWTFYIQTPYGFTVEILA